MKLSKHQSDTLYIMKFFAVISIVFAHTTIANLPNDYIRCFLSNFKCFGVYIFFILAGYFFDYKKYKNIFELLKSKFFSLCIPWFFCGIAVYCTRFVSQPLTLNLFEIINWLLGNGTYLYFMTMLILIYLVVYVVPKNKNYFCYTFITINIISILLTQLNILPTIVNDSLIPFSYLNPYLNIFNWIGIFSFGLVLREHNIFSLKVNVKYMFLLAIFCLMIITVFKIEPNYWNVFMLLFNVLVFFIIFDISNKYFHNDFFVNLGKNSFSIYLLHMPFIVKVCANANPIYTLPLAILTVIFIHIILNTIEVLLRKVHLNKIFSLLTGVR